MSEIETELQKATKIKPAKNEDEQDYFKRLIEAVQELPDAKWEKLSTAAQNWANDAGTAVNKKRDIEPFPDDEPPAEEDPPAEEEAGESEAGEGEPEEETVASKRGKKAAAKKAGAKKPAAVAPKATAAKKPAAAAKSKPAKKGGGAQVAIKKLVIKNPKMTTEDIAAKLKAQGLNATTSAVSTIRSGTLQTLRLVQEIGLPKGEI